MLFLALRAESIFAKTASGSASSLKGSGPKTARLSRQRDSSGEWSSVMQATCSVRGSVPFDPSSSSTKRSRVVGVLAGSEPSVATRARPLMPKWTETTCFSLSPFSPLALSKK